MATGLRKQKKYSWKETNLALFGSDLEKKVAREHFSQHSMFSLIIRSLTVENDIQITDR